MITDIFASGASSTTSQSLSSFITIGLMMATFYFLMIRPQKKRQNEHESLLKNLKAGDQVATSSGIIGTIKSLDEQFIELTVNDQSSIKMQRHAVSQVLPQAAPSTA